MNEKPYSESSFQTLRPPTANSPVNLLQRRRLGRDSAHQPRILVIDDHFAESPNLRGLLEQEGFRVDVMSGVKFPVTAGLFGDYHAVILDVMVPQSNGFEGLRNIRRTTQLPVLVLTARGGEEDRIAGLEMGADDYVVKPCRPREVVARIHALLRRRSSF